MLGFFKKRSGNGMEDSIELSGVEELHEKAMEQNGDLYSFIDSRMPSVSTEKKIAYMNAVLKEHIDMYEYDEDDELRRDGYIVNIYYPKREESDMDSTVSS